MLDIQLAIAKQRGLDLITEASADRAAARVVRIRAARRKRAQRDEISCARAAGGPVRTA
ncbi:MAG TPA: hypothetical protein VKG85_11030 [Actinomycetes bacterium]|nr:hypothetical protein [Actinomycetes bacterium]